MQHKILPCKIQILILAAEIGKKVQIAPHRAIVHLDLTISEIVPIHGPIQDLCQLIGKQHYYAFACHAISHIFREINILIFSYRLTAGTIGSTAGTGSAHQRQHSDAIVNSTENSASAIPTVDKRFRTTSEGNAHFDIKPRSICKSCIIIIFFIYWIGILI